MDTLKSLNDPTLGAMYSINYARDTRAASNEILKPTQQKPSEFVTQGIKLVNDPKFNIVRSITNPYKLKNYCQINCQNFTTVIYLDLCILINYCTVDKPQAYRTLINE